jgi:poly(A)-specific ribonuclease
LNKKAYHEAGFDSLLTATIMLRLSAKLNNERQRIPPAVESDTDQSYQSALENVDYSHQRKPSKTAATVVPVKTLPMRPKPSKKNKRKKSVAESRFQTRNIFDSLVHDQESSEEDKPSGTPTKSWQDEVYMPDTSSWHPIETVQRQPMELIPAFDDLQFWGEFGNTLRIYGTEERVLRIAAWDK